MPHIHEHYDFIVSIYIVFNDKVLLVYHPRYDMWTPVGGHIELQEDPEEALFREIKEETGLEVEILGTKPEVASPGSKFLYAPNYLDVHEANSPHRHIALTYFGRSKTDKAIKSAEHTKIKWFSDDELEVRSYRHTNAIKFYAHAAIKRARA